MPDEVTKLREALNRIKELAESDAKDEDEIAALFVQIAEDADLAIASGSIVIARNESLRLNLAEADMKFATSKAKFAYESSERERLWKECVDLKIQRDAFIRKLQQVARVAGAAEDEAWATIEEVCAAVPAIPEVTR